MRKILLAAVCAAGVFPLCGAHTFAAAQSEETVTGHAVVSGRPAADVVVWLDAPNAPRTPEARLVLEQRNMQFTPRVMAARVGSTVELPNNDRVFHNVFSFNHGKPFDQRIRFTDTWIRRNEKSPLRNIAGHASKLAEGVK